MAEAKTRTLEVQDTTTGKFRITIPATAKVTYGLLHPGQKGGYTDGNVLRIYEGTKQTAVFRNVLSFRDLGYPVLVERVTKKSDGSVVHEGSELLESSHSDLIERAWVPLGS